MKFESEKKNPECSKTDENNNEAEVIEPTTSRRCSIDMIRSEISTGKLLLQKQESLITNQAIANQAISERVELARNIEKCSSSTFVADNSIMNENRTPEESLVSPKITFTESNSQQEIDSLAKVTKL